MVDMLVGEVYRPHNRQARLFVNVTAAAQVSADGHTKPSIEVCLGGHVTRDDLP